MQKATVDVQISDTYVGFDSARTDNPKAPGAISAAVIQGGRTVAWHPPRLARFDQALAFIRHVRPANGITLIALDQPILVPNAKGMRPVERAAASVVSWLGGGVQPAYTGKTGMFCADSPIWPFLNAINGVEDPERARTATEGVFLMEVFPALGLASLDDSFALRLGAPKYNPRTSTFKLEDWRRVTAAVGTEAKELDCPELAEWCRAAGETLKPRKADHDRLDSAICLAIALRWRLRPRDASIMLGDLTTGYMVAPASATMRAKLVAAAMKKGDVRVDGLRGVR